MAFKMKGHSLPGINQRSDAKKGSSAFQKHDGKKFKDAGFMDTHFPSGAPRNESAMKMYGDKKNPGLKMKQDSPMKGYKSDAQRKAVHASKAEKTTPAKLVGKTIKKIKAKRAAKKEMKILTDEQYHRVLEFLQEPYIISKNTGYSLSNPWAHD